MILKFSTVGRRRASSLKYCRPTDLHTCHLQMLKFRLMPASKLLWSPVIHYLEFFCLGFTFFLAMLSHPSLISSVYICSSGSFRSLTTCIQVLPFFYFLDCTSENFCCFCRFSELLVQLLLPRYFFYVHAHSYLFSSPRTFTACKFV